MIDNLPKAVQRQLAEAEALQASMQAEPESTAPAPEQEVQTGGKSGFCKCHIQSLH